MNAELRAHWLLEPDVVFLNHGSFGACPRLVLEAQAELRERMERQPVRFFVRELPGLLDRAREQVAAFVDADPAGFAFVRNATAGVGAVLRSLAFAPGDELLTTDHAYPAVRAALDYVAAASGARVVVAELPWPGIDDDAICEAVLAAASERTRLAVLDHVTSPTALVLPITRLVEALAERGIDTLVDGAHAPGMLPLSVRAVGAAYYTGNFHKWVCAPKGAAMLWVREDRRAGLHPLSISHGYRFPLAERSRYQLEFDWTGTDDFTPCLLVPRALEVIGGLLPGGWPAVRAHNRALALSGRELLAQALGLTIPCPATMVGTMATLPLPDGDGTPPGSPLYADPLHTALGARGIEVPVIPWPAPPRRQLRISAQLYNDEADYTCLAQALAELWPDSV